MSRLGLPWFGRDDTAEGSSVWHDLRNGRAGLPLRIGLSVAAAGMILSALFFVLGLIEQFSGRVADAQIISGLALGGLTWCGVLAFLWTTYRRWWRLFRALFMVLAIWVVTIPICVLIGEYGRRPEFLIAAFLVMGTSGTIIVIALNAYQAAVGRPIKNRMGDIRVQCPGCGYSMVGLESCRCPECGSAYTIDQIIGEQDYAVLRHLPAPEPTEVEVAKASAG